MQSQPRLPTSNEPWPWERLLTDFIASGYSEALFWASTPRQISTHFAAATKRIRDERNRMMETAYLAAFAPHQKKPPALKDLLLPDDTPRRRQTPQEIRAALVMALGGKPKDT